MAVYGNVKVKVFIHDAVPNIETAAVGTMARDIKDYIDTCFSIACFPLYVPHSSQTL